MRRGRTGRRRGLLVPIVLVLLIAATLASGVPALLAAARAAPTAPAAASVTPASLAPAVAPAPGAVAAPLASMTLTTAGAVPSAVALTWTAYGLGPTYTVEVSANNTSGSFTSVATVTGGGTTYIATGLAPGTTYWWQVTESGFLSSGSSNVLEVTQPTLADLTDAVLSATQLQFNWTNNATYGGGLAFVSYQLLESVGGHPAAPVATINQSTTRTTTIGLSAGSSYVFYLNTTDCTSGCGAAGAALVVTESNAVTFGAPLPLSAQIAVEQATVDVGQQDLFTCTPAGGESPFSFAWQWAGGPPVAGNETGAHAFAATGATSVQCEVTDHLGTHANASTSVFVNADPRVNATANRTAADVGQPVSFSCTGQGGTGSDAFTWSFGDGAALSGNAQTHTYASGGTFRAVCVLVDGTGTQATANVSIVVSPTLSVTATTNAPAAAPGTSLTFSAAPVNGSGTYPTISWTFGDGSSSSGLVVHHLFAIVGDFAVNVSVTDTNGARAVTTLHVAVAPLVVTFPNPPSTSARTGVALSYSADASGGAGGPYNYTWTFGDGILAFGPSVAHTFHAAGTYHVTLLVSDRLGATNLTTFGPLVVSAPPPPSPLITAPVLLALALLVAILAFLIGTVLRRRRHDRAFAAVAGRVPVTDTDRLVRGSRVCRVCGTTNVALRTTCEACGASLRGTLNR